MSRLNINYISYSSVKVAPNFRDYPPENSVWLVNSLLAYDSRNNALVPSDELGEWLRENAQGYWRVDFIRDKDAKSKAVLMFMDSRDTILFKLWWSDHE